MNKTSEHVHSWGKPYDLRGDGVVEQCLTCDQIRPFAGTHTPSNQKLPLLEWVLERFENCCRIARQKEEPADRDSWMEDAEYFRQILVVLSGKQPSGRQPVETSEKQTLALDILALMTRHVLPQEFKQEVIALCSAVEPSAVCKRCNDLRFVVSTGQIGVPCPECNAEKARARCEWGCHVHWSGWPASHHPNCTVNGEPREPTAFQDFVASLPENGDGDV